VSGYAEAVRGLEAVVARDPAEVHGERRLRFRGHGRATERVAVLLHGLTSSPPQMDRLAEILFERGLNVVVPRLPRHGHADRMTGALAGLSGAELLGALNEVLDLAAGLGARTTVAGISMGGVLAAWAAQHRADLDRAVLIAPSIALPPLPVGATAVLAGLALRLPNAFFWWDPAGRAASRFVVAHAYPRVASHALARVYRLAADVAAASRTGPPGARSVRLVLNSHDPVVRPGPPQRLLERWRAHGLADARSHVFPPGALGRLHDFVEPADPRARTDVAYPPLVEMLLE
jgi:alpha-beta hydrolase superfamily lysophospholipase